MAGKLYMVRHGKTALNAPGAGEKIRGFSKAPLEESGRADAKEAGNFLKDYDISKIISSNMPRTEETAKIIADILGVKRDVDAGIGPWDLGILTGKLVEDVWPTVKKLESNPNMAIPGGETYNTWWKRYSKTLWKYINDSRKNDENIVLVTHARNLAALEPVLAKEDAEPTSLEWAHAPEPGAVVELCVDAKGCKPKLINGKLQGKTLRS